MYYYKGEMIDLLNKVYNLLKSVGFDVRWTSHDHSFVCDEFKSDGKYGTGSWEYSMGYDYCDDLKDFRDTVRIKRISNDNGKEFCSHIYRWKGEYIFWANRMMFQEGEWLECLLSCMMPHSGYAKILSKYSIVEDKDDDKKLSDISPYKRVSRDLKLNLLLND